ncbi:MAG: histidine kinase N-terminal 7TM domain-containing protein [Halorhabdus sp.]
MVGLSLSSPDPALLGHVVAFGVAAVACVASVRRARAIEHPDTRRGLVALLLTSGGWAAAHVAYLVAPTPQLQVAAYQVGLAVGLSTVGPWLYFCSAYTGRSLHRDATFRRVAVLAFAGVLLVKFTNPLHHLYFTTAVVDQPFPHLAVHHGTLHWLVMGLSYALAAVGYFMLLELFLDVGRGTTSLAVLTALTGLPIALDVAALHSPVLLAVPYEPLGVAAFAVGVCFVYLERLRTIRVTGSRDDPAVLLDGAGHIRDYNDAARDCFDGDLSPASIGSDVSTVRPDLAAALRTDAPVLEVPQSGESRFYQVATNTLGPEQSRRGRVVFLTDVTHRERYRRKLERQNERLDRFAHVVSHDLRNPLNVAQGHLEMAREDGDDEHLAAVADAHDRMAALIDDLLSLARQGQPIDETEPVDLDAVARRAWGLAETESADLDVESGGTVEADPARLQQLFENLFRNAVEHGGDAVRVGTLSDPPGFYVADDGPGIPPDEREAVFETGYTTDEDGTGFGLGIVAEIVDAHDWTVAVTDSTDGGARFEVTGVEVAS